MMGITQNVSIFWHDHNNAGGGIALIINKKFMPEEIALNCDCEILAVKMSKPQNYILCLYTDYHQHLCVNSLMNC